MVIQYNTLLVDISFDIYVTNGQNKQTLKMYNLFWIMHSFPKNGGEVQKRILNMKAH